MSRRWALLVYTVPTTPSRTRAHIWREIRRQGALLLRDGVAALPHSRASRTWAVAVAGQLRAGGGTATMAVATFAPADERRIVAAFQAERGREYAEIEDACGGLREHIARERQHAGVTFEELEADLDKIRRWLAQVRQRDRLAAPARHTAERAVDVCERDLARFAERAAAADLSERAAGPLATRTARGRRPRGRRR